jgi:hypothetical protein
MNQALKSIGLFLALTAAGCSEPAEVPLHADAGPGGSDGSGDWIDAGIDGGSSDDGGPSWTKVCGDDYVPPPRLPVKGLASATFMVIGDMTSRWEGYVPVAGEIQIGAPSWLRAPFNPDPDHLEVIGIGCPIQAQPGPTTLRILQGGEETYSADIELADETHSIIVVYLNPTYGPGSLVYPVDLAPTSVEENTWNVVWVNLMQDNYGQPVDIYIYPPGVYDPSGQTPERLVKSLGWGGATSILNVPANTLLWEEWVNGTAPSLPSFPLSNSPPEGLIFFVAGCDFDPTNDAGGLCYGSGGYSAVFFWYGLID